MIEQKELIALLNLFYQYIYERKIKIINKNENDAIEFFVYDHLSGIKKEVELFSIQFMENYHSMKIITKIKKNSTNRIIKKNEYDKVLVLKEIINQSTILNFHNGIINIVGKVVSYQDSRIRLKTLFSFQFNDLMKNYKILDGHQGLLLEF